MKHFAPFALDTVNQCLWSGSRQISLPPKPFAVLRYLVENRGRLVSHDELLDALWPETYVQPQVLRTYVLELRKLLGDDARQPRYIQSLPKRGYCFLADVFEDVHALQPAPAEAQAAPIVGRESELNQLLTAAQEAAGGARRTVFITGESGIGKTALVDAFIQQSSSNTGGLLAIAQCVQGLASAEPHYPIMDALGQLCTGPEGDRVCRVLARRAPAWMPAGQCREQSEVHAHQRMPGDICAAFEELSAEKPVTLVIEDLHWADEATLHLLSAIARRRTPARLLVVGTCQPPSGAAQRPLEALKQDLGLHRLCCELALGRLRHVAMTELIRVKLGQEDPPDGLDRFVWEHSEGNPLFAISILEHLITERVLVRNTAGEWILKETLEELSSAISPELAKLIEHEIGHLNEREQSLLEAGSLMQIAFPAWAVAAALGMEVPEAEQACNELARRLYFVTRAGDDELPDGTRSSFYVFAHGLYREVLYQRQASTVRARRHVAIAHRMGVLFEGRGTGLARAMAMHFEAADDWRSAIESLRTASRHAVQLQALAEAKELLERARRMALERESSGSADVMRALDEDLASLCGCMQES